MKEKFESKRAALSDRYQADLRENPYDFSTFVFPHELTKLYDSEYTEDFQRLNDQCLEVILSSMDEIFTEKQAQCLKLYFQGYTQTEIGKIMNCNQTSVQKTLFGNWRYVYTNQGKQTVKDGGIIKKIKKIIKSNKMLKRITLEMRDIDDILLKNKNTDFIKTSRCCSINLYYLISTLFKNDDEYLTWQLSYNVIGI